MGTLFPDQHTRQSRSPCQMHDLSHSTFKLSGRLFADGIFKNISFMATTGDIWIILSFQIFGNVLHVEHISCVNTNCHLFSLNSFLCLTGRKHYQKITIPLFRFILKNFAFPCCFPCILFYCYLFAILSSAWFVIAVCDTISVRELVRY